MSIKTLRKRIALVAVSALGVGLLSVAPAMAGEGDMAVSTTNGTRGVVTAATQGASGTVGKITVNGYASYTVTDAGTGDITCVTVSGGTVEVIGVGTVSAAGTTATRAAGADLEVKVTATTVGTNMVVRSYDDADADGLCEVSERKSVFTWNVIATGVSGVFSASDSLFSINDDDSSTATAADTLYANVVGNGNEGRINIKLYDGLGTALATDLETVAASVKSGDCLVGDSGLQALTFYSVTTASGEASVYTAQNTTDAPTVCVVDITVNGTVVATKTFVHQGKVASLEVSSVEIADSGAGAQTGLAYVVAKDSAGNSLGGVTLAQGNGANDKVSTMTFSEARTASASTSVNRVSSAVAYSAAPASVPTSLGWTCSGVKGSASMTVKYTPANGVAIHSNTFTASCFGDAVNYKASFDKATYVPGDIATLTITGTDSAGNAANDQEAIGTATTYEVAIAGSNMTAVTAPTNADKFTAGKKTYKFIVGSTEGSYQMSVDLPKFNSTTYNQAAQTVAYSIKTPATGAVSNAEVLAAIVKLIASINKQIRALQKSLRR